LCFLPWGDEPGQAVIKKLVAALTNKKTLVNLLLSNLFLILYVPYILWGKKSKTPMMQIFPRFPEGGLFLYR
jgi:hypothetical protein